MTSVVDIKAVILLTILSLLWSSTYIFVKIAGHDFDPVTMMAGRAVFGCMFLWLVVAICKKPLTGAKNPRAQLALILSSGLVAFMWYTMAKAETALSATMTSFMMTFLTISSWLIATFITRERPFHIFQLIGILIAVFGTAVMLGLKNIIHGDHCLYYAGLYLLGLFAFSCSIAINKHFAKNMHVFVNTAFTLTYVALYLVAVSMLCQHPWTHHYHPAAILSVLAIGILSTGIGYIIFFWLAHHVGHVFATLNGYLVPIFTFIIGAIFLGESVSLSQFMGLVIAFVGVFLTNK